ncbi:MAG TPA: YkgJ family cysteine cluster protein [Blastocatellia bacterium]|nr:YkgJ family cysteine cluster protein [Blastocatellia bacterium]
MSVNGNGRRRNSSRSLPVFYNCSICPAYCCSYDRVEVTQRDLLKIARHFGISFKQAEQRHTKDSPLGRILRHKKDHIFKHVCEFLDSKTRQCTIYDARPAVCRGYPDGRRCGYYDFLASERRRQCDDDFIPTA